MRRIWTFCWFYDIILPNLNTFGFFIMSPEDNNLAVLPRELFQYIIGPYLDNQGKSRLSKCSRFFHSFIKEDLEGLGAAKLLDFVIRGEQEKAKEMLKANPSLLLKPSQAEDYSGRTIIAKPFQAAIAAEDERMWEMMEPYFDELETQGKIESAREEKKAQFDAQFPAGIEDEPADNLKTIYDDVAQKIVDAKGDTTKIDAALADFRPKVNTQGKTVKSGKHFNMQHLLAAYQAYLENFDKLDDADELDEFWQQVIGYVQRQMPANYAQAHCSGIQSVLDKAANFKRTLDFSNSDKFFPLKPEENKAGLGFDFAAARVPFRPVAAPLLVLCTMHRRLSLRPMLRAALRSYVKQKQNHLGALNCSLRESQSNNLPAAV